MNTDYIFFLVIGLVILSILCNSKINEKMSNTTPSPDVINAVRQVYNADVQAIRNLSDVATRLQAGGLTVPGNLTTKDVEIDSTLKASGRLHITGGELLFILNKEGVMIGKEWGGNGNLNAQGKIKESGNDLVPRGVIVAWSGTTAPGGWAICDGQNGTPDLRGRFIRMFSENRNDTAWGSYYKDANFQGHHMGNKRNEAKSLIATNIKVGDMAGSDFYQMSIEDIPAHTHKFHLTEQNACFKDGGCDSRRTGHENGSYNRDTTATGSSWHHNNAPPFYALAFIMKL